MSNKMRGETNFLQTKVTTQCTVTTLSQFILVSGYTVWLIECNYKRVMLRIHNRYYKLWGSQTCVLSLNRWCKELEMCWALNKQKRVFVRWTAGLKGVCSSGMLGLLIPVREWWVCPARHTQTHTQIHTSCSFTTHNSCCTPQPSKSQRDRGW